MLTKFNCYPAALRDKLWQKLVKTGHFTSTLLPHFLVKYVMKLECSTIQPHMIVIQFKPVQSRLFVSKYLQGWHDLDHLSMLINLQYYNVLRVFKTSTIRIHVCVESCMPIVNRCVDNIVQCWTKGLSDAVAICCAEVTSNDVKWRQRHSKQILKLK